MAEDPSLSHEEALALVKRAEEAKKAEAKRKAKPNNPKAKEDPSPKDSLVPASDCSMGSGSSGSSSTYDSQVPDYGSNFLLDKREEKKEKESLQPRKGVQEAPAPLKLVEAAVGNLTLGERVKDETKKEALPKGTLQDVEVKSLASRSDATAATHLTSLSQSLGGDKVWQVKEPKALGKRVGIDWHWTLQCQDSTGVDILPNKNLAALQKLQAAGFFCVLLSYCFRNRELEVRKQLGFLARDRGIQFDQVIFVRHHRARQQLVKSCASMPCLMIGKTSAQRP